MARRLLQATLATTLCLIGLSGCATVEMRSENSPLSVSDPLQMQSRTLVRSSARRLTTMFSKEGWAVIGADSQQTAASILLWGRNKAAKITDPVLDYIERRAERRDVLTDITRAGDMVTETASVAEGFLTSNPKASNVKKELKSLEGALLSARQAEDTFAKAMARHGIERDHESYTRYIRAVNRLRDVTNAYGVRMRAMPETQDAS